MLRGMSGVRMRVSLSMAAVTPTPQGGGPARRAEFVRAAEHAATKRAGADRLNLFFVAVTPDGGASRPEVAEAAARIVMSAVQSSLGDDDVAGWISDNAVGVLLGSEDMLASQTLETRFWDHLADRCSRSKDRPAVDVVAAHVSARANTGALSAVVEEGLALVTERTARPPPATSA